MRQTAAILNDVKLQYRHGFYYLYLAVTLLYILILVSLPEAAKRTALTLVIFSDPAMLGFFFIGAIVLLERSDNTLQSLFVTPISVREYLLGKVTSLSFLGLVTSVIIALAVTRGDFNPALLILGVTLTSILFVLFGVVAATRFRTVNGYIFGGGLCSAVFTLPLIDFFDAASSPLFWFLPTKASLVLIGGAFVPEKVTLSKGALAVLVLAVWIVVAYTWARCWFVRHVLGKVEGRRS